MYSCIGQEKSWVNSSDILRKACVKSCSDGIKLVVTGRWFIQSPTRYSFKYLRPFQMFSLKALPEGSVMALCSICVHLASVVTKSISKLHLFENWQFGSCKFPVSECPLVELWHFSHNIPILCLRASHCNCKTQSENHYVSKIHWKPVSLKLPKHRQCGGTGLTVSGCSRFSLSNSNIIKQSRGHFYDPCSWAFMSRSTNGGWNQRQQRSIVLFKTYRSTLGIHQSPL